MFIGRKNEKALLESTLIDDQSHFIAVYGRRRIGKTFLVREAFGYRFTFQHAGLSKGGLKEQLFAFGSSLRDAGYSERYGANNWLEAFEALKELIRRSTERKKVIFIDELSWMDTRKSDLMIALENFWNGWASGRKDIVLVICTSATSWMLTKVIHNKGGLYHRLTAQIPLRPFSLSECEEYVKERGLALNRNQILQCYMVFGGVPYYWSFLKKGLSVPQNMDDIFFAEGAPLKAEFTYLYASIFRNPTVYLQLIRTLAGKKAGMTREELIAASGVINSGDLTVKLEELESCGFIRKYNSFGMKKKNAVYQLIDFFTLFYFYFLEEAPNDPHFCSNQINTPAMNTWMGLAFERVCLEHVDKIIQRLGISGVLTQVNAWYCRPDPDKGIFGSQIDLLIVRKDQIIDLCEMKYAASDYTLTEKVSRSIARKIHDLVTVTGTRSSIHPILVTSYGLVDNAYSGSIQAVITTDDLFA